MRTATIRTAALLPNGNRWGWTLGFVPWLIGVVIAVALSYAQIQVNTADARSEDRALRAQMNAMRTEYQAQLQALQAQLNARMQAVQAQSDLQERRLFRAEDRILAEKRP